MKKFIIAIAILVLIVFGATVYLNKVFLPGKFKSLVVSALEQQTSKQVTLKSLEFSIFRGLVLRDLVMMDGEDVILSTRQATCRFFIWPIFKKRIIIPSIYLKSPYIFLNRRQDGTFNLQDLFLPKTPEPKRSEFSLAVFKVAITNGNLVFQDDTLPQAVKKEFKNIQLNLALGLPVKFKFNLSAVLAAASPALVTASGEYKILSQELTGNLNLKGLSTNEFSAYYGDWSGRLSGLAGLQAQFNLKNRLLQIHLDARGQDINFTQNGLSAKFSFYLLSNIDYNLDSKKLEFNGACDLAQAGISGLGFLNQVENLHGRFVFNQRSLVADSLKGELWGLPFEVNLGIKDFSTKALNISTDFDLSILPKVLKDKFGLSLISSAGGLGGLLIKIYPADQGGWVVQGDLKVSGAGLKLDKVDSPVEEVEASLSFSHQGLSWKDTKFKYQGKYYQSIGALLDFNRPQINLKLYAEDLSVVADFNLAGQKIKILQLKGKYLDTQFLASGDIDRQDPVRPLVDLSGQVDLELSDLNKVWGKQYLWLAKLAPAGKLDINFSLNGPVLDSKNCFLQAGAVGKTLSVYGLKATDVAFNFLQEEGIAKIPTAYFTFYDGVVQGTGALNFNTADRAFRFTLEASGINLEKLKNDTASGHKNIAGIFLGSIKVNGAGLDLDKLDAAGNFAVSRGRLGELNLLQGLGKLLLARDLGKIEFSAANCNFLLKDRVISTDKFKLHSEIVNLSGPVKIGLDNSLEGALDVEILNEMVSLDGTFKDVTTAIVGKGGKLGVIKLSGSLNEPKYSFKTAVGNIIQGLASVIFKK